MGRRRTAKLHENIEERLLILLVQHRIAPQLLGLGHLVGIGVGVGVRVSVTPINFGHLGEELRQQLGQLLTARLGDLVVDDGRQCHLVEL